MEKKRKPRCRYCRSYKVVVLSDGTLLCKNRRCMRITIKYRRKREKQK